MRKIEKTSFLKEIAYFLKTDKMHNFAKKISIFAKLAHNLFFREITHCKILFPRNSLCITKGDVCGKNWISFSNWNYSKLKR